MKHVLKRLQDGVDSGAISLEESRTRLGPTEIYFDTCDLKLYTKPKHSLDTKLGYNHLFLFYQDETTPISTETYKEKIQKACLDIEELLNNNQKFNERIDLVKQHKLSLTIITSSIEEEFELYKSLKKTYSQTEFNATFGDRYKEDFKNYIYKELIKETTSKKESSDLGETTLFLYKTDLVKFFGGDEAVELLTSLKGQSRERFILQGKITSDLLKSPHTAHNFFNLEQIQTIESRLEEYKVWNNQIIDLIQILKKNLSVK